MAHQRRRVNVPPADELDTPELAHTLCHQLLPGPTTTSLLVDDEFDHPAAGLPRSWLIQAHKASRRQNPDDHTTVDIYIHHSDTELLASLSAKLDFDLEAVQGAAENNNQRPVLEGLYTGLRQLRQEN